MGEEAVCSPAWPTGQAPAPSLQCCPAVQQPELQPGLQAVPTAAAVCPSAAAAAAVCSSAAGVCSPAAVCSPAESAVCPSAAVCSSAASCSSGACVPADQGRHCSSGLLQGRGPG